MTGGRNVLYSILSYSVLKNHRCLTVGIYSVLPDTALVGKAIYIGCLDVRLAVALYNGLSSQPLYFSNKTKKNKMYFVKF